MAKFQSPLLGFNNNIRHRGRVFHVQTEDSGVNHPHVITHLFMDGGRILKSVKKSYAEHVGSDGMQETVRVLMKEQHKAMFIALRDGQFDDLVEPGAKPAAAKPATPAAKPAAPAAEPPKVEDPPPPVEEPPPNTIAERAAVEPFALETSGPRTVPEAAAPEPVGPASQPQRPSAADLTLDFDALERDATVSPIFKTHDLPPPPKNLFAKERGTGAYSTLLDNDAPAQDSARKPPARPSAEPSSRESRERGTGSYSALHDNRTHHDDDTRKPARPSVAAPPPPSRAGAEGARYAAARPASIFGSTLKPAAPASSVFGDDHVSDKSLDEVILSYLAEDLDPRGK